jgi:hypothetical protein
VRRVFDKRVAWALVWALGAAFMVARAGFWNHVSGVNLEDVNTFHVWSDYIAANHALPLEDNWQYPAGAAFLMLIPRLGGDFSHSFVATMLVVDLVGLVLLAWLARRERRDAGVWVWLLALPLLFSLPILRFDLVPTVLAIAALLAIQWRPAWFGALVGLGAMVKVWPVVLLFGEWDRRRLLVSIGAAAAAIALVFAAAAVLFANQTAFLTNQDARGLQVEAVAATPWQLRQMVTGEEPHTIDRFGTREIDSGPSSTASKLAELASLAALAAAALWWWLRTRAIRAGRDDLESAAVGRDFVFAIVLLLVVTSRVLSPQYMIWLLGLAAVVLSSRGTRLARPAWIVVAATILTAGLYLSSANIVLRNVALMVAAVDASVAMALAVRGVRGPASGAGSARSAEPRQVAS